MNICIGKCVCLNANARSLLGRSDCAFTYLSLHVKSQCATAETTFDISVELTRIAKFQKGTNICFPNKMKCIICFHRFVSSVLKCSVCFRTVYIQRVL